MKEGKSRPLTYSTLVESEVSQEMPRSIPIQPSTDAIVPIIAGIGIGGASSREGT